MNKSRSYTPVFCGLAIAINVVLGTLISMAKIPLLFLDTTGTVFVGAVFGPWWGLAVGLATNLVLGFTQGGTAIPFGLVNAAIGVTVGLVSRRFGFGLVPAAITGLVMAVVAPLIGTPIAIAVYGGLTGGVMDIFVVWLTKSGSSLFTAAFLPRIASNLVDKVSTAILVSLLIKALPKSLLPGGANHAA